MKNIHYYSATFLSRKRSIPKKKRQSLIGFCCMVLLCCCTLLSLDAQNTPIFPLLCPSGQSIYTIDHADLSRGSLPGGFCIETELSGTLSGSQSTANYTVLNGAFVNTPNFIADGGALTFTATNDGDDADLTYVFCQPVTNPYIIIGPTGPEIGTVYSIFESDGTTPINVAYIDGQPGFIVQNGNEITTTTNNRAGYVQIQDNTPRTSFIINIVNGGSGGADGFDIGIGVCMPDPPTGNETCPIDLYLWEKSDGHIPLFRDANGVFYEKSSPSNIGDAVFSNAPLCGQICLVEANYSIGDCVENTSLTCNDGIDNDGDGLIDCDDPDCDLLANCTPVCPLTVVEITPRCPATDGLVTTRYWTPLTTIPAACCFTTNGGIPQEDIFTAFSATDGVTGLPLHQNGQSTSQVLLGELGVEDENIPGNVSGNMPNSNEQALQDCWLIVPEGVKCFELEIGGPRDEASAFYVGAGINSLVLLGTNLNGSDTYNVSIPCDAMTTTCGHSILRVRLYHHDSGNRSNSRVRWNIGNGFEEIPAKWLQSISQPDTDVDKPMNDTPDPTQSYLAVQDANGDFYEARPGFGNGGPGTPGDEPIHHPSACADIAPANCPTADPVLCQQVLGNCCQLEVTCPPPSLGTISCNDPIPPAATNEAEFEALGGIIEDDPGPCGTLVITHQDVFTPPSPICDGRMLTRTYTVMDDNTTVMCTQTLTITPPNGPTITCPADMTVECFADIVVNANDATATTDCMLGVTFTVSPPVQNGDDDCPGTTYTYTYTAEDECGRTDECEQVFTIQNEGPMIVCPPDMTVQCIEDFMPDANDATVTTSCMLGFVTWVDQPHITGAPDCNGTTYEYTYHALDDCGRGATCIQTITIVNDPPEILLSNCGSSNSSDPVYDNFTWNSGDNDGSGFGPWVLNPAFSDNFAGHFVFTSTENGNNLDSNVDNDIDRNQRAWGFYANTGNLSEAIRPLSQSMTTGSSLSLQIDNGFIDVGGTVGFGLRNNNGENIWEFFVIGGNASYTIQDASGSVNTGIAFTDEGLQLDILQLDATTVRATVTTLLTGQSQSFTSTLMNPVGGQSISQVRLFNFNAGPGASQNLYANSLVVCSPETIDCVSDINVDPADATVATACGEELPVTIYAPEVIGEGDCPGTLYRYTYRVEDQCEREATIDRVFVVGNNAPPVIVAPDDVTCNCLAGVTPNIANATVTTSCDYGYEVSLSGPVVSGPMDCPGTTYTYTYTVTDNCGREDSDEQTFTIQNDGPEFINAPIVPLQLNCEDEGWEYIIQAWLASVEASNSCGSPLTVLNNYNPNSQGLCINNGTTNVTWRATDQCGRQSTVSGMIILADTEPPVFVEEAQDELDICNYNTPHEFDDWVDAHGNSQALDGCWGDDISWSTIPNNPSFPSCMGMMGNTSVTVTFVARDGCGNKSSTTATFTALMAGGDLVEDEDGEAEAVNELGFALYQNQPNPFKNETVISFNLPESMAATLTVYDVTGKALKVFKGDYNQGYNEVQISRSELNTYGILFYQLETATKSMTKKMIILE